MIATPLQFPRLWTVKEERVIRPENEADFRHRIACAERRDGEAEKTEIAVPSAGCEVRTAEGTEGLSFVALRGCHLGTPNTNGRYNCSYCTCTAHSLTGRSTFLVRSSWIPRRCKVDRTYELIPGSPRLRICTEGLRFTGQGSDSNSDRHANPVNVGI